MVLPTACKRTRWRVHAHTRLNVGGRGRAWRLGISQVSCPGLLWQAVVRNAPSPMLRRAAPDSREGAASLAGTGAVGYAIR